MYVCVFLRYTYIFHIYIHMCIYVFCIVYVWILYM